MRRNKALSSAMPSEIAASSKHAVGKAAEVSSEVDSPPPRAFHSALRYALSAILIWAGLSKLSDPVSFYTMLLEYRLPLPAVLLKLVAVILPWLELLCGLTLLVDYCRRATLLWVTVLFCVFLAMVGQALFRGLDISCGCFNLTILGIPEASGLGRVLESMGFAALRNLLLVTAAAFLFRRACEEPSGGDSAG